MLAVDDWAWRRGQNYGSILVDLERNRVVDLLPDRETATLSAWLQRHRGVEVVARDRAGAYADGVRQGAPDAVQVADRWHLLRNLGEALQAAAERHHAAAKRIGREILAASAARRTRTPRPSRPGRRGGAAERGGPRTPARPLRGGGAANAASASLSEISRCLDVDRRPSAAGCARSVPAWRQPKRGTALDLHAGYLEWRWVEGCRNAARLWRELSAMGFQGRPVMVRAWATRRRCVGPASMERPSAADGRPWQPPSGRRVARVLMADVASLAMRTAPPPRG